MMDDKDSIIRALIGAATGANAGSLMTSSAARMFNTPSPNQAQPGQGSPESYVGGGGIPEMNGPQGDMPKQGMPDMAPRRPYDFNTGATDLQFTGEQQGAGGGASSGGTSRIEDEIPEEDLNNLTDEELAELVQLMGLGYKAPEGVKASPLPEEVFAKYNIGKNPHPALTAQQQGMSGGEIMAQQVKDNQNWKAERNNTGDWKKGTGL